MKQRFTTIFSDSRSDNLKSKIQNLKWLLSVAIAVAFMLSGAVAEAQQPKSLPKIGYLSREIHPSDSRASSFPRVAAFRDGLRELGYIEGKNILVEYRYAEGRLERLSPLAEELVRLKVDIIVTDQTLTARAAKKVTTTIPILFLSGSDPTQTGLAVSLARPGGNVTGLTSQAGELREKRLELLKEVVPKVTRFALLEGTGGTIAARTNIAAAQVAAQALGVQLQVVEVNADSPDFDGAFKFMVKERLGALVVGSGSILDLTLSRKKILQLAAQNRMPAIYGSLAFFEDGGLMFYGANALDLSRRGAIFVDKILKGAKPADLPVERPIKFDFSINLKTANQIGLTIPPNVLVRAQTVIR